MRLERGPIWSAKLFVDFKDSTTRKEEESFNTTKAASDEDSEKDIE